MISVLTESWSSRYKSSISEGKTKKVIRRLGKRSNKAHDQSALKMLKLEGFGGTDEPISAEELPQKLMDAVKGFHEHARYFMFGRTGDTPESLRPLLDAADQADDQIERYAEGDLAESAANGETRHVSGALFVLLSCCSHADTDLLSVAVPVPDFVRAAV